MSDQGAAILQHPSVVRISAELNAETITAQQAEIAQLVAALEASQAETERLRATLSTALHAGEKAEALLDATIFSRDWVVVPYRDAKGERLVTFDSLYEEPDRAEYRAHLSRFIVDLLFGRRPLILECVRCGRVKRECACCPTCRLYEDPCTCLTPSAAEVRAEAMGDAHREQP